MVIATYQKALLGITFLLCLSPGLAVAGLEDGRWYRYTSAHFEIYSKLGEKVVAKRIRSLEAFRAVAYAVVGMEDRGDSGHTTKTYLLSGLADARRLAGRQARVAGFMRPGLRQNVLVIGRPQSRSLRSHDEIAFHEYAHYLMRNASSFRYPMWYDEGFAELLSTISIKEDHAVVGEIVLGAGYTLLRYGDMPVEQLVRRSPNADLNGLAIDKFYARSWLLVHYLSFSNADGVSEKMVEYLTRYNGGETNAETFEQTFGLTFKEFDATLERYTRSIPAYTISLDRMTFESQYQRERLTSQQIAYELGQVAVVTNPAYGRKLFRKILDDNPNDARALAGLATVEQMSEDYATAEALMREAISLDPEDYLLHIDLADLLLIACRSRNDSTPCTENPVLREASALYRRAFTLAPEDLEAQVRHATMQAQMGDPERAVALLKQASIRAPWSYEIIRSLGIAFAAAGQWSEARRQLNQALSWNADNPEEHGKIRMLMRQIAINEQLSRANAE